jgi:hypothetical protein
MKIEAVISADRESLKQMSPQFVNPRNNVILRAGKGVVVATFTYYLSREKFQDR